MQRTDRVNAKLELAVRYGIIMDRELGVVSAWAFMANNGVSNAVILRVLLHEEKRREADQLILEITERNNDRISKETMKALFSMGAPG